MCKPDIDLVLDFHPVERPARAYRNTSSVGWWSGGAKVLGKLPVPGRPTNLAYRVGQGPIVLSVGAGGGCLDIFYSHLSPLSERRPDID